jgi:hypothetical protein
MTYRFHPSLCDHVHNIGLGIEVTKLSQSKQVFHYMVSYVISLKYGLQLNKN